MVFYFAKGGKHLTEIKKLLKFTRGYGLMYSIGIVSIILSQGVTLLSPLVIRTTIDSIIGSSIIENKRVAYFVGLLGGRAGLRENLWIIGIIIIFITLLRGIFLYLKIPCQASQQKTSLKKLKTNYTTIFKKLPYEYHVSAETGS